MRQILLGRQILNCGKSRCLFGSSWIARTGGVKQPGSTHGHRVLSTNHLLILDSAISIYSTANWILTFHNLPHLCFFLCLCLFSYLSSHSPSYLQHFPVFFSHFPFDHLFFLVMSSFSHSFHSAYCFSCIFPPPPFLYIFPRSLFPLFQDPFSPPPLQALSSPRYGGTVDIPLSIAPLSANCLARVKEFFSLSFYCKQPLHTRSSISKYRCTAGWVHIDYHDTSNSRNDK